MQLINRVLFLICLILVIIIYIYNISIASFKENEDFLLVIIKNCEEEFKVLFKLYSLNKMNFFKFFIYFIELTFDFLNKKIDLFILYIFKQLYYKIRRIIKK
jgi:hypothetical protein